MYTLIQIQGTNLDNLPNKPRYRLEFHLFDVLIQHFHKNFIVWLWKNNSRKQIWYNSLLTRIREKMKRVNCQGFSKYFPWHFLKMRFTDRSLCKIPNLIFLCQNSSTITNSNTICKIWFPSQIIFRPQILKKPVLSSSYYIRNEEDSQFLSLWSSELDKEERH